MIFTKTKNGVLIEGLPTEAEMQAFFNDNSSQSYYLPWSESGEGNIKKNCLSSGTCVGAARRYRKPDPYSMSAGVYSNVGNPRLEALVMQLSLNPDEIKALAAPLDVVLGIVVNLRRSMSSAIADMNSIKNCNSFFVGWGVWEWGEAPPRVGSMSIWNLTPWETYDMESWNYGREYDEATMLAHIAAMGSALRVNTHPSKALRWLRTTWDGVHVYADSSQYSYTVSCNETVPSFYEDDFFNGESHYPGLPLTYSVGNLQEFNEVTGEMTSGFDNFLKLHSMTSLAGWRCPLIEIGIPNVYNYDTESFIMGPTVESIELIFQEDVASFFWTGNKNCIEII